MKKSLFLCALPALILCGCQNLEPEAAVSTSKTFEAVTESYSPNTDTDTKTTLDPDGNVLWTKGDQISVFAGSTVNEQYQVTDASDGQTSAGLSPVTDPGFVAGGEIDNNVAFYPYASSITIAKSGSGYALEGISLPATQSYAEGSFGNGAFPMATVTSSTDDMTLKFKNVLGGLKLQLTGTATIASVSISGNNGEILCGPATVTASTSDVPAVSLTDESATTVTLDCGEGVQLNATTATAFVIALPPMTMAEGFTVTVTDTEGMSMEIKTTKSQTINRSRLLKMPEVAYEAIIDDPDVPGDELTFTSSGTSVLSLQKYRTPSEISLEYKIAEDSWAPYTIGSDITLEDGEWVSFRAGINGNPSFGVEDYGEYYYTFTNSGTGNLTVSGNIMSLVDQTMTRTDLCEYMFYGIFENMVTLVDASKLILPSMTLTNHCYENMFYNCTKLKSAPALPATTLTLGCYKAMFLNCAALTSAPELPAKDLMPSCYSYMFMGCTKLSYLKALFTTTPGDTYTDSWLRAVATIGTFEKSRDATWDVSGDSGIPSSWTITYEPEPGI